MFSWRRTERGFSSQEHPCGRKETSVEVSRSGWELLFCTALWKLIAGHCECFIESKQCAHVLALSSISRQGSYTCFLDMRCQIILIGGVIAAFALRPNGGLQPVWRSDLSQWMWQDLEGINTPFELAPTLCLMLFVTHTLCDTITPHCMKVGPGPLCIPSLLNPQGDVGITRASVG